MADPKIKTEQWNQETVPMERWGKDHWTTLLYLETVAVDRRGEVEAEKMRTAKRNWRLAGRVHGEANIMGKDQYPTRLKPIQAERADFDSVELCDGHDDWECLHDAADLGLLEFSIEDERNRNYPLQVTVKMTDLGRKHAGEARKRREETGRATPA